MEYSLETRCQHLQNDDINEHFGAVSYPIYMSSTFAHKGFGVSSGYDYSRLQNPTRDHLERIVAGLEHGTDCIALASGISAIGCVMELFKPGDHVLIDEDLYGGSIRLFREINQKNGVTFSSAALHEGDIENLIKENTKAIYLETPTNPMMNVTDLRKLSEITKSHGILLIVDNTFMSPYLQNPLDLSADIVIHSGTKFLAGHHDTIAGFIVVKDQALSERLRFLFKSTGAGLSPFDSWLIIRGIKTLAVRMDRAEKNAQKIAKFLEGDHRVTRVLYPGLKNHPGHDIMKEQARGFGAMITFDVPSKEFAIKILENLNIILFAESLGGTESLITYPITQTHADVPAEILEKNGIYETTLRLSVGIENVDDLIRDLKQAFTIAES
ncbi:trans-sulfuration enzyme family protein [Oribacterium sp. WCC10]|uniref:trans-sulfuration enzyme family protein n=1 Tax=Oribacterium sp. WCC10 TaxID=1855343 RepID=UPI0008F2720B|nr:PLP-dependent aspartate aminotransferase family protein [Oribacterium sp. WCC10]SFG62531.1 cystathionine gamma-synthase [Oribacterium sp. WCC10]